MASKGAGDWQLNRIGFADDRDPIYATPENRAEIDAWAMATCHLNKIQVIIQLQ